VVLPSCAFVEKQGTYTNLERRVQRLNPLRLPKNQSRSDFDIFLELLRLLEVPVPGETPEAIFQEISKKIPNYQGILDGEQWPKGKKYLYGDGFPIGKAKLIPLEMKKPQPLPEDYPCYLIQRPSLFGWGGLSLRSENLRVVLEKPDLEMNAEDALSLEVKDGETIQVSIPEGKSLRMKVSVSSRPARGVITTSYPSHLIKGLCSSAKVQKVEGESSK